MNTAELIEQIDHFYNMHRLRRKWRVYRQDVAESLQLVRLTDRSGLYLDFQYKELTDIIDRLTIEINMVATQLEGYNYELLELLGFRGMCEFRTMLPGVNIGTDIETGDHLRQAMVMRHVKRLPPPEPFTGYMVEDLNTMIRATRDIQYGETELREYGCRFADGYIWTFRAGYAPDIDRLYLYVPEK